MYREIPEDWKRLIEPIVEDHGLELVDLELLGAARSRLLRVTVDTPQGDGRVPIERCVEVSRELETQIDAADAVPGGRYRLEVSSPGLDRLLAREKDFAGALGREIRLQTRRPLEGRRRFRGRLLGFADGRARLEVDGREVSIPFAEVARANAVYEFTPADFGRGERR